MLETTHSERKPVLTLRASRGWSALNLREVWQYRDLLMTLSGRDVKLRYRQTALGAIWVIIQPLISAGIFAFVFGKVAKLDNGEIPYFLLAYAGLLGWNAFNSTLSKVSSCMVGNSQLVSKVFFPRLVLPLAMVPGTLIDFGVALGMMAVMMLFRGVMPGIGILLLPVWLLLIIMMALGIGLFASALMVSYRDVQYVLPVAMQFLMYASPVAYSISAVPESFQKVYYLNPLAGLFEGFRWSLLGHCKLWGVGVVYSAVFSMVVFIVGAFMFKKMERKFADVI